MVREELNARWNTALIATLKIVPHAEEITG